MSQFNPVTGLTPAQTTYVEAIVKDTGLSFPVVAAWTRRECTGADALKYEARKDFNYLNIGKTDSGNMTLTRREIWKNPADSGHMTAAFILGTKYKGEHIGSGAKIYTIKGTAGKPDMVQLETIWRSGWATSRTYSGPMLSIYKDIIRKSGGKGFPSSKPPEVKLRALIITSPYTVGIDIEELQRKVGVTDDGEFGPDTLGAALDAAFDLGIDQKKLDDAALRKALPKSFITLILGKRKPHTKEKAEAKRRKKATPPTAKGRKAAIAYALTQRGVVEYGNNNGARVMEYQHKATPGWDHYAWCGAFTFVALLAGGVRGLVGARIVSVINIVNDAKAGIRGFKRYVKAAEIQPGDLVCFKSSSFPAWHVALCVENDPKNKRIKTIDGNRSQKVWGPDWTSYAHVNGGAVPNYP